MHRGTEILIVKMSSGGLRPRFESLGDLKSRISLCCKSAISSSSFSSLHMCVYIYICRKCLIALFIPTLKINAPPPFFFFFFKSAGFPFKYS